MKLETLSTDQLKSEYVQLCTAAMIYGTKTEMQRKQIAAEIDRRETKARESESDKALDTIIKTCEKLSKEGKTRDSGDLGFANYER